MSTRSRCCLAWVAALAVLSSCAPRTAEISLLEPAELQRRYLVHLADRDAALTGVDADLNLWLTRRGRREPGVGAALLMAGTDRLRLRIGALFGTALDAAVDGDAIRVYVPRMKGVWDTRAADPPVDFPDAGAWLVRAWTATWRPPASAWTAATRHDSLLVLRWSARGDSLQVAVGASGLPREVTLQRRGRALRLFYDGWRVQDGRAWPVDVRCRDMEDTFELRVRLRIMWFREFSEDRLSPGVPDGTGPLAWDDIRELLDFEEVR